MNPRLSDRRTVALLSALVFVVALNLRPAITALGPLLPEVGTDLGLDKGLQGLLGALPVLVFAGVSPLVYRFSSRFGPERLILVALLTLTVGTLIRSWSGAAGLWIGTVTIGVAIAVGNVLVPVLAKRDYPRQLSWASSLYSTCITVGSAVAAATVVPLATAWGWRWSLAFWALPAFLTALLWTLRIRAESAPKAISPRQSPRGVRLTDAQKTVAPRSPEAGTGNSLWKSRTAWLVTLFMGLQSTAFYAMVTWLPTLSIAAGYSPESAGLQMFVFQLVGIPAGLALPLLMRKPESQLSAALLASAPMPLGLFGMLLAPSLFPLWAAVAGLGAGMSLVMAMTLIGLRSANPSETARLSGMVQSIGYLMAAVGPVAFGFLAQSTGGWAVPLIGLIAVALAQVVVGTLVGRVSPKS